MGVIFERSEWERWAGEWGLKHVPQRGRFIRNESLVGPYKGYLLKIGWSGEYGSLLYVLVRFPKGPEPERLHEQLCREPGLTGLLPMLKRRSAQRFLVNEQRVLWRRLAYWRRPKSETIRGWVERLVDAVAKHAPAFAGRCEQCGSSGVTQYVLYESAPVYFCSSCQERLVSEGTMAERKYQQLDANYLLGTAFGVVGAAIGGLGWAALAVLTKRIYALVAIGIAWLVGWGYYKGAGKIDRAGQLISSLITVGGVVFGEVAFYAYVMHRQVPGVPLRLDVGWEVFLKVVRDNPAELVSALLFGLIGIWYVVRFLQKPRFTPTLERP